MSNNAKSFLKEWTINFIKNKDLIQKKLISVESDKDGFDVKAVYKDKVQYIIVESSLGNIDEVISKFSEDKNYGLVILNTLRNFNVVVENWDKLVKFRLLCIYFVNPFSNIDKKWLIFPYTHNKICDDSSLKTGLRSMFEMVEPLTEEDIEIKFNS